MAEDNDKNDSKESSQQLDSKEELAYSLSNLRKCIPLMGKYCIPTTPMHYAVWYAYVAQTDPVIIKEIDEAIPLSRISSLPPSFCTGIPVIIDTTFSMSGVSITCFSTLSPSVRCSFISFSSASILVCMSRYAAASS